MAGTEEGNQRTDTRADMEETEGGLISG